MARPTSAPGLCAASPAAEGARRWLAARAADVDGQVALLPDGRPPGEEAVHDLRVSLRRLRAALRFFTAAAPRLRASLKSLQDAAGAVRDLQLQLAWIASKAGAPARPLAPKLREAQPAAEAALRAGLLRFRERTRERVAHAARSAELPGKLGGRPLRKRLARRLDEAEGLLRAARLLEPGPAHALRIGLKSLRYEAELLLPAFPEALGALLRLLAPVQESLGLLHDADVRAALLEQAGLPAAAEVARRERRELARPLRRKLAGWARAGRLGALARALRERR